MIEPKFKKGDYIINRTAKEMAIYDKLDAKGYMHFKRYRHGMLGDFVNPKEFTLQINYQKFYEPMTDEEKDIFNKIIEEHDNGINVSEWEIRTMKAVEKKK